MECAQAFEALRSKLEASFGKAVALMIVASAANAADVSTVALTAEGFRKFADAVGRDQRVVDMWGSAGAIETAMQWKQMV